jgi:hypothetical protein
MKIVIIIFLVALTVSSNGSNKIVYPIFNISKEIKEIGKNIKNDKFSDPCLDAALEALDNAFAFEQNGWGFCAAFQTTAQGYYDCSHGYTVLRQLQVEIIYANLTSCPSGNGQGVAINKRALTENEEDLVASK